MVHGAWPHVTPITRRVAIAGGLGTVVAACSGGSEDPGSNDPGSDASNIASGDSAQPPAQDSSTADGAAPWILVQRFPQNVQGPGKLRLPISRASDTAQLLQDGPDELSAVIRNDQGEEIIGPITARRRDVAPGPYYDFRVELDTPGVYFLVADGGPPDGAAFQVVDPATISVPGPGDVLNGFDTPTVGDGRGVDPICTREPEVCEFHSLTLAEALSTGQPVAYYVGTPAFCSTGSCGPALEALIELQSEFPDVVFLHAEVYTDRTATEVAPAVTDVGMSYEPALFITDAEGVITERLDALWGLDELREVLDNVT